MKPLLIIFLLLLGNAYGADDEDFDLEDDAPKTVKVKQEINEVFLRDLLVTGKYLKLTEIFEVEKNVKKALKDPAIRKILLNFQIETGAYKAAFESIEKTPFTSDDMAYFIASEVYRLTGDYDKFSQQIKLGLEKYPESTCLNFALGNQGKLTGDTKIEAKAWSKIKSLYRQKGRKGTAIEKAFLGLGSRQRSPQASYNLFQRAYKADAKYINAFVWAGEHCSDKYMWSYAIEEYGKALQLNKSHALANAGMAYVLMEKGDYQRARELIAVALETNPNCSEAIQLYAAILIADDKNREALLLLKEALKTNQQDMEILSQIAACYEQQSDSETRDEYIKKVLSINPRYSQVYLAISQACENRRQFPAAVEWAKKGMALNSRDWEGYFIAGMNLLRLGEEKEGYKILDRAFALNGFNIWAKNILTLLDRDFKKKEYVQFETEHFVIKLHRDESEIMFPYLKDVVEEAYEKYTKKYDIEPVGPKEYNGKILLLMFNRHNDFSARTVGLPGLGALGACFGQIITMPSPIIGKGDDQRKFNWKRVFEHEFVHVLTLQKSSYNIPRWFTEGISTWEEEDPQSEVDRQLKWAWANKRLLPLEDINSGFSQQTYPNQIGVSYYHASLVCKYINDQYGYKAIQKMLKLYRDGKSNEEAIEGGTGRKLSQINKEVESYIDAYVSKIPISIPMEKKVMADLEATLQSFELTPEKELDLAGAYVHYGQDDKASVIIDKILKKNDANVRAHAIKAYILFKNEEFDSAKKAFQKVLSLDPLHYAANYLMGQMSEKDKKFDSAAVYYTKALEFYSRVENQQNNLYFKLVNLYDKLGNKEKALETLRMHTVHNNKNYSGFVRYADRLKKRGDNRKAIEAYIGASYIYPFDLRVHDNCGTLLVKEKRYIEAIKEFKVALELEPRSKSILYKLFDVYIQIEDKVAARAIFRKLKRFFSNEDLSAREKLL